MERYRLRRENACYPNWREGDDAEVVVFDYLGGPMFNWVTLRNLRTGEQRGCSEESLPYWFAPNNPGGASK